MSWAPGHACVYIPQVLLASTYICAAQSLQGVHMRSCVHSLLSCVFTFLTRVGVYLGVCVYTHTHTHTAHGVLDVSPGVGTRQLEGPKNPDYLNLDKHVFVYVYNVHVCIYML